MRKKNLIVALSAAAVIPWGSTAKALISYEGDVLPQNSTPAWSVFLDDTGGTGGSVSGGILTTTTAAANQSLGYRLWGGSPGGWNPTAAGSIVDVRVKVVSQAPGAGRAADFLIATGSKAWLVRWGESRISEELFGGGFDFNTTDAFHTYRFGVTGLDGPLNIYVDGDTSPSVTFDGLASTTPSRLDFGDQLDGDGGTVQWDYIRWDISAGAPTWAVNSSGDWNVASNWGGTVPNAVDAEANFLSAITSSKTLYSDIPVTVGKMTFNNANTYQIAGTGSLSIDVSSGNGSISVVAGEHKINIPLFINDNTTADIAAGASLKISNPMTLVGGTTLTKTGSGTLSIEAPGFNAAAATIASAAGVTNALMDLGSNTSLNVSGGTTNLKTTQHLAALSVDGGTVTVGPGSSVVVATKSLNISGSGKVDLQNGKMVVDYTGASVIGSVKTAMDAGSLTSSQLTAGRAIGYGEASDLFAGPTGSFAGQTVDSTSVVVAYTVVGDASLDGTVNSADFNLLAGHYGQLTGSRWTQGDFDGDGKITTLDFNTLAGSFGQSLPAGASLGSVVPEPGSVALVIGGLVAGVRRRRR